jgi:hypothetical protein
MGGCFFHQDMTYELTVKEVENKIMYYKETVEPNQMVSFNWVPMLEINQKKYKG